MNNYSPSVVDMLICYEYDYTADADVGIDDVAEDAVGNMLEDVGTQHRADDDAAEAIEIINGDSLGEEAVVGSHTCHHHIANQKIGLSHRHIVLLRRLTLDEVKHGRRTLHTKETAHQSAQCSRTNLYFLRCRQLYALAEKHKVDADKDECYAKDSPQNMVFDACQGENGNS